MQSLHKKVVDFDGDIPMDQLLELQKKLRNKSGEEEVHSKTFITNKNAIKSNPQAKPLFMNAPSN